MFEVGAFYMTEDWTMGGNVVYECVKREEGFARFETSWASGRSITRPLKIYTDGHEEYVVLSTYSGIEHRLYAR